MRYAEDRHLRRWSALADVASRLRLAAGLVVLGVWLVAGCSRQQLAEERQPATSCSQYRLDVAQRLFQSARVNLVRYYKERGLTTLNLAYSLAGDSIQAARATRTCADFDDQVRALAVDMVRTSRQLRTIAFSTMRDPGDQALVTLLQGGYTDAFAGRDLD